MLATASAKELSMAWGEGTEEEKVSGWGEDVYEGKQGFFLRVGWFFGSPLIPESVINRLLIGK